MIEVGKLEIEPVNFDLAETIRDTLKTLAVKTHEKGLGLADHDVDLLLQQMNFFRHDGPELVGQIRQAVDSRDARNLELAAHRLKGLVARYAAQNATELAHELERCGKTHDVAAARQILERLGPLVAQLLDAIQQFVIQHAGEE